MSRRIWATGILLVLTLMFSLAAGAAEKANDKPLDQKALGVLENMSNYLADSKTMTFTTDTMVDASINGQLISFFSSSDVTVRRPDGLKAVTRSDNKPNEFYFDGKNMTTYSPRDKMYAVTSAPGTLDELFPFAMQKAGIHTTFSDILTSDPYAYLTAGLTSATYVGLSHINRVECDHLAFKGDGIEWQIWIAAGKKPVPMLMSITYPELPDKPRFIVSYSSWKMNARLQPDSFKFKKPSGATQIEYQPVTAATTSTGGGKK